MLKPGMLIPLDFSSECILEGPTRQVFDRLWELSQLVRSQGLKICWNPGGITIVFSDDETINVCLPMGIHVTGTLAGACEDVMGWARGLHTLTRSMGFEVDFGSPEPPLFNVEPFPSDITYISLAELGVRSVTSEWLQTEACIKTVGTLASRRPCSLTSLGAPPDLIDECILALARRGLHLHHGLGTPSHWGDLGSVRISALLESKYQIDALRGKTMTVGYLIECTRREVFALLTAGGYGQSLWAAVHDIQSRLESVGLSLRDE